MKISTNSRYALRFLARLAAADGRLTTGSVARQEGISEKMLERIAAKLKKEGFVSSVKGIGGGYELALPPEEITVHMVLSVMETPYLPLHCIEHYDDCSMFERCAMLPVFEQIDMAIRSVTEHVTLRQIADSLPDSNCRPKE